MDTYMQPFQQGSADDKARAAAVGSALSLLGNRRLIIGVALVVALAGMLYALSAAPVYQANMLIQIQSRLPLEAELRQEIPATTEVELLRSRSILDRVVATMGLDVSIEPKRFPFLGAWLARDRPGLSTPGVMGRGGYAWGAEHARLASFTVPAGLMGEPFVLTATGQGRFRLTQQAHGIALDGRIGELASLPSAAGNIAILVTEMQARTGAQFRVSRIPQFEAVERLQRSVSIAETAKQSNVIRLSLEGTKPELISSILNEIGNEYIRRHAGTRARDGNAALVLYERQLAQSQRRLQELDAHSMRLLSRHGTADLGEESRSLAQQSSALHEKLSEAERNRLELSGRYLSQHPTMVAANEQVRHIERALAGIESKRRTLAQAEREIVGVNRDRQVNADINASLLSIRQKLDAVTSAGRTEVRLLDRAETPVRPVTMGLPSRLVLAIVGGMVAGLLASLARNAISSMRHRPAVARYDGHFRLV